MTIQGTKVIKNQGYTEPFVKTGGRWYLIQTKPSMIEAGIASMIAVTGDFSTDYENRSEFSASLAEDPEDGRLEASIIPEATNDPVVVALARKFALTGAL